MTHPDDRMTAGNIAYLAWIQATFPENNDHPYWQRMTTRQQEVWEKVARAAIEWDQKGIVTMTRMDGE